MITQLKSPEAAARWLLEWTRGALRSDSRQVQVGDAFVAWPGQTRDGREFVAGALAAGASTCLVEREGVEAFNFADARVAALPGLKAATGHIASHYYGEPTKQLAVLAVTGTNGKTSTAWWLAQALTLMKQRCGVVGTLGVGEPGQLVYTGLTTPDPVLLQQAFRKMADEGFAACAIEASSIGILEHRLAGCSLRVALLTNFTQDHLDYHGSMEAYWAAKRQLFDFPGLQAAVVNVDDAKGAALAVELAGRMDVWSYALGGDARLSAHDLRYGASGLCFTLREGAQSLPIETGLIGEYNVANLLGVIGGLRALGHSLVAIAGIIGKVTPVPGRMQRVGHGAELPQAVVDYAHTPDALDKALTALRPLAQTRGGKLTVLFGCGGNRDKTKRPLMGAIAARLADRVILASDNPRHEAALDILADIAAGVPAATDCISVPDRRDAIRAAISQAGSRDVVLLAGKGHEDYQEVAGQRHHFDDVEEARAALIARVGL